MKLLRGWIGEKKAAFGMWLTLNRKTYRRYHNIILPSKNGTTQIDHLIVSPFGLFIVETKNRTGWIFGSANQSTWTQVIYDNKYTFQNPLRQTYRQKKVLCAFLNLDEQYVHTVIYFVGRSRFKTPMPANVIRSGLGRYIRRFKNPLLSAERLEKVVHTLEHQISTSNLKRRDHIRSLRARHSSTTICPKCGSKLVERTASRGKKIGSKFLGCTAYPKCRFTKNIDMS